MRFTKYMLAAVIAAIVLPSEASAVTLLNPDGTTAQPQQSRADNARVPTPNATLTVYRFLDCDGDTTALGCTDSHTAIWIWPKCARACRFVLLHELGHVFDAEMPEWKRTAFSSVMGRPNYPWFGRDNSWVAPTSELFADSYARCALGRNLYEVRIKRHEAFALDRPVSDRQLRRICRIIRA